MKKTSDLKLFVIEVEDVTLESAKKIFQKIWYSIK